MADPRERILVLDSSAPRVRMLCRVLAEAGFDVWPGRNVQDALVMAAALPFAVVVAEESCAGQHPELWEQLAETLPRALVLVYDRSDGLSAKRRSGLLGGRDEVLLGVLLLLMKEGRVAKARAA